MKINIKLRGSNVTGGGGGGVGWGCAQRADLEGATARGVEGGGVEAVVGGGQQRVCHQPLRTALHTISIRLQNRLS